MTPALLIFAVLVGPFVGEPCRTVEMEVTAYCPCEKCCGRFSDGITASGRPVTANGGCFVAADRRFPFGTRIAIPGYAAGRFVPVLDRGGAIKGNRLDVFFPDKVINGILLTGHERALQWGRQTLLVEADLPLPLPTEPTVQGKVVGDGE